MSTRPTTARSEISSAISEDGHGETPPRSVLGSAAGMSPAKSTISTQQAGFAHLRGVTSPTNRTIRSPTPATATSIDPSSRPQSPESTTSRTHVPSLTAQGFLRPLTSSRLQQQRLNNLRAARQVNNPVQPPAPPKDGESDYDDGLADLPPQDHRRNHSVTTGYTEETTDNYGSESQQHQEDATRGFAAPSAQDDIKLAPAPLNLRNQQKTISPLRSPHSFRSAFSIGSKQFFEPPGHQHLPSSENSPRYQDVHEKEPEHLSQARPGTGGKNYEYFLGNTIFFMGGRLQNARDRPINLATLILLILPCVLFFVYSASWLWHHVSPAIPIVFAYVFYICLSSFVHASLSDPGIYPRYVHPLPDTDPADALAVGPPTNDWVMVRLATSETAAMDVPVKYCKTCDIWRPPRCYHCRVCDNCVETLDHHCVWLNNCVGRRNYRYFFAFVSSGTILALLLAFASLGQVIAYHNQEHVSFVSAMNHNRVPFAMFIYGVLALVYPALLWGYHLILTGRGETTREYLASRRFPKSERHRPFTLGNMIKNWVVVLARPRPPSYMQFNQNHQDGDQRLGTVKGARGVSPEGRNGAGMELKPVKPGQRSFEGPTGKIGKKEAR